MKDLTKKQKIVMSIVAIIIIAGIAVALVMGFNFDLRFQSTKKLELYLEKEYEISDIKNITNEVMPNEAVLLQKVEVYEDSVSIIAKEITEEQKQSIIEKVNEKYQLELNADETEIATIPNTRGRDLIKPYVVPFIIATVVILAYMAIRYRKLNWVKIILKTIAVLIIAEVTLMSLIAITRIPIGRLTIPMIVTVYILTFVALTAKLEKQLEASKEE